MTERNDLEVEAWGGHPWYPAVRRAHEELSRVVPGYRIDQIKEKFNGLRYYYSLPEEINTDQYRARADRIIAWAEGWCEGFEYVNPGQEEDEW